MQNPWTSRTETAMHAPFLQPRNVERRGSPAMSHVESRVSRDTDIIPYRRYGVHNNAVLDSYVYYDPIVFTWFYRDRRERVDQDFLDDYFSDRKHELNYRGIHHPRIKFENGQWVPNENAAPQPMLHESKTPVDSKPSTSAHENTSSHSKTSRRHRSSAARHEAPSSSSGRSMFEDMAKFFNEYPRRKNGGRHISSTPMHEAPKWGREETVVEKMVHRITDENRREDLARSQQAVVHRTSQRNTEELQQQLLPEERQPVPSTMRSMETTGLKGRTTEPYATQSHRSRYQEGYQSRTLANVKETKSTEVAHAAQVPPTESPNSSNVNRREVLPLKGRETVHRVHEGRVDGETSTRRKAEYDVRPKSSVNLVSSNLQRRDDLGLKGRETVPATYNWILDTEMSTRRKAELDVQPQQDALPHGAVNESIPAYTSQSSRETVEGVRVSYDTLRRARSERDPRHEGEPQRGDEGGCLQEGMMQLVVERASGSGMSSTPQTNAKAGENARRQRHERTGDESRRLHEARNNVVSERRRSNDSDDEGTRRRKLYLGEDEDHRLHEFRKDVVSERQSSNDSDDEDRRWRTLQSRGDESRRLRDGLTDLVIGRDVEEAGARRGEYRRTTEGTTNDEQSRHRTEERRRDENIRLLKTSKTLVVGRGSETTGRASNERDAGCNPASEGDVERGRENVPVSPGRTLQDDKDRRQRAASGRVLELEIIRGYAIREAQTIEETIDLICDTFEFEEEYRWLRDCGVDVDRKWSKREYGRCMREDGVSGARMAVFPPSKTIHESNVPRYQSPARSIARSNPSPGYSIPQPSRHPSERDQRDRRRSTRADESIRYSRHPERLREDVSQETRRSVSSQYSNANIGVCSPHTWGYRPQVHNHGLLQPQESYSIVEIVDERERNECSRERGVAVQRRGAGDTSHTQSQYIGPTRASLAVHDAYWAKYSPSPAAGGKICPPAEHDESSDSSGWSCRQPQTHDVEFEIPSPPSVAGNVDNMACMRHVLCYPMEDISSSLSHDEAEVDDESDDDSESDQPQRWTCDILDVECSDPDGCSTYEEAYWMPLEGVDLEDIEGYEGYEDNEASETYDKDMSEDNYHSEMEVEPSEDYDSSDEGEPEYEEYEGSDENESDEEYASSDAAEEDEESDNVDADYSSEAGYDSD